MPKINDATIPELVEALLTKIRAAAEGANDLARFDLGSAARLIRDAEAILAEYVCFPELRGQKPVG